MPSYPVSGILLGTEYTKIRDNWPSRTSPQSVNNTTITAQWDKGTTERKKCMLSEKHRRGYGGN